MFSEIPLELCNVETLWFSGLVAFSATVSVCGRAASGISWLVNVVALFEGTSSTSIVCDSARGEDLNVFCCLCTIPSVGDLDNGVLDIERDLEFICS